MSVCGAAVLIYRGCRSRASAAWASEGIFTAAATTPTINASMTTFSATPVVELAIAMTRDTKTTASTSRASTLATRINVPMVRGYSPRRCRVSACHGETRSSADQCVQGVAHQLTDTCRRSPDGAHTQASAAREDFLYWLKRASGASARRAPLRGDPRAPGLRPYAHPRRCALRTHNSGRPANPARRPEERERSSASATSPSTLGRRAAQARCHTQSTQEGG
jgi:hypothetical protein